MARLNIEDCWWTDPRRSALAERLGGDALADGAVVRAWRLAQEFWKHGRALVPKNMFDLLKFGSHLIEVGLAEIREDGVYIRGSSAYLDWVAERREAAKRGGKKSAEKRSSKRQPKSKQTQPNAKQNEANANQTQPSVSGSFSVSDSNTKTEESIGVPAVADSHPAVSDKNLAKAEQAQKANQFVGSYVKAYQTRFPDSRPEDLNDGKVRGQILAWVKDYPLDRACQLIQVYFQMEAKWFGTKGYDFLTFRNNLNKIGQALDSGTDPDGHSVDWAKVFGDSP